MTARIGRSFWLLAVRYRINTISEQPRLHMHAQPVLDRFPWGLLAESGVHTSIVELKPCGHYPTTDTQNALLLAPLYTVAVVHAWSVSRNSRQYGASGSKAKRATGCGSRKFILLNRLQSIRRFLQTNVTAIFESAIPRPSVVPKAVHNVSLSVSPNSSARDRTGR